MSKADKIEQGVLKIIGISVAVYAVLALREAAKRKATEDYFAEKHQNEK